MSEHNITNVIVMYGSLPETCYSVTSKSKSEIQKKINKLINDIYCKHFHIDSPEFATDEIKAKISEAQEQSVKQENIILDDDYEIYFITSTIV